MPHPWPWPGPRPSSAPFRSPCRFSPPGRRPCSPSPGWMPPAAGLRGSPRPPHHPAAAAPCPVAARPHGRRPAVRIDLACHRALGFLNRGSPGKVCPALRLALGRPHSGLLWPLPDGQGAVQEPKGGVNSTRTRPWKTASANSYRRPGAAKNP